MFLVEAFERTIGKFVSIAEAIDFPFHLTGGSISSAYGEPRLTQDIDIVVSPAVAKHRVDDLIDQLASSDFLYTGSVVRQAIQTGDLFQLLDRSESLKLDIECSASQLAGGEVYRRPRSQKCVSFLPGRFPWPCFAIESVGVGRRRQCRPGEWSTKLNARSMRPLGRRHQSQSGPLPARRSHRSQFVI